MAKFTYGVEYLRAYDPKDPSHVARKDRLTELPSGPKLLADAFDCILGRVSVVFMNASHILIICQGDKSQGINSIHS